MNRVYHHYTTLEEYHAGMWKVGKGAQRLQTQAAAADLLRCPEELREAMLSVMDQWPRSCEQNLTSDGNRQAWLGWAACCISVGATEDCTRIAWHTLTQDEQREANSVASELIANWDSAFYAEHGINDDLFAWAESA